MTRRGGRPAPALERITPMIETRFLAGQVIKRSLPSLQPPIDADAPPLKRLLLPQGELAQFYDADEPMRYFACLELRPGTVRGNHYHSIKEEWFYLAAGELLLVVEAIESKLRETIPLQAGDLAVIHPRVAHAYRVTRAGHAIEFAPRRFDPADTCRHPLD
jgi:mannose-6-phosphate isomerase-like protein (cupin superfamily)